MIRDVGSDVLARPFSLSREGPTIWARSLARHTQSYELFFLVGCKKAIACGRPPGSGTQPYI